jgi:hypothetical protein
MRHSWTSTSSGRSRCCHRSCSCQPGRGLQEWLCRRIRHSRTRPSGPLAAAHTGCCSRHRSGPKRGRPCMWRCRSSPAARKGWAAWCRRRRRQRKSPWQGRHCHSRRSSPDQCRSSHKNHRGPRTTCTRRCTGRRHMRSPRTYSTCLAGPGTACTPHQHSPPQDRSVHSTRRRVRRP